jgi:P-type conjugative transfer protein TrbJ
MTRRTAAVAFATAFCFALTPSAFAQLGPIIVFDPSNYAKNTLTELNTLQTTINQATQIANELKQLAYEVRNSQTNSNGVWGTIQQDLSALTQIAKVGQSISYADQHLSSEFVQMYPGYSAPSNYTVAYKQWAQNTLGGIQGALQVAGLQSADLQTEGQTLAQLQDLSDGAVGHMQAIQVGNMIAVQEVQQLQKLRQLQMAQLQGQFGYLATQQQSDLSKYALLNAWLTSQSTYRSSE